MTTKSDDETSKLANILMQIPGAALSKDDDKTGALVNQMLARLPGAVRQAGLGGQQQSGFSTPSYGDRRQMLQADRRCKVVEEEWQCGSHQMEAKYY